ncbi:MAG: WG repeat-containing protein [bacterium]
MINNGMLLVEIEGGKHGYIGTDGKVIISIEYDAAAEIPYRKTYFKLAKNGKYGIVDQYNEIKIPFKYDYLETSYDHDLVFCVIKEKQKMLENWAVYDQDFNLIIDAELDEQAINLENYKTKNTLGRLNPKYYLLGLLRSKIIQSDRY